MKSKKKIKEVSYYWYDHCLIRKSKKMTDFIEDAINNHDYITFKILQKALNNFDLTIYPKSLLEEFPDMPKSEYKCYLPDCVHVEYEDGSCDSLKITKELFNKISFSEYECG